MPLLTPDYNNYIKRAWTYRASILRQLKEGERPISKPTNEYPYGKDTKVVDQLRIRGFILSESEQAEAENMYRKGMSMAAIYFVTTNRNCRYFGLFCRQKLFRQPLQSYP